MRFLQRIEYEITYTNIKNVKDVRVFAVKATSVLEARQEAQAAIGPAWKIIRIKAK